MAMTCQAGVLLGAQPAVGQVLERAAHDLLVRGVTDRDAVPVVVADPARDLAARRHDEPDAAGRSDRRGAVLTLVGADLLLRRLGLEPGRLVEGQPAP